MLLLYWLPLLLRFDRGVVHVVGYSVYHYSLKFDRGVVNVVVILSAITF